MIIFHALPYLILIGYCQYLYRQRNKLKKLLHCKSIAHDDYSAYIKGYINLYKWFQDKIQNDEAYDLYTLRSCCQKLKESFKHCENE